VFHLLLFFWSFSLNLSSIIYAFHLNCYLFSVYMSTFGVYNFCSLLVFTLQGNHALSIRLILMMWRQITSPNNPHYITVKLMGSLKNVVQVMVFVPMRFLGMGNPILIPRWSERYFINSWLKRNMLLWSFLLQQDFLLILWNIYLRCTCVSTHL
jgi:hypothetical protein